MAVPTTRPVLQLLAVACLTSCPVLAVARASPSVAFTDVQWESFLSRHDMRWSWSRDPRTWPSSWETAAWLGNGLHGLSPFVEAATGTLRFELGRADVYSCGFDPRLPIGFLRLRTAGAMLGGNMTQSLYVKNQAGSRATSHPRMACCYANR